MALDSERLQLFEQLLNSGLNLRVRVTGRSMGPFLQGGEILTIREVAVSSLRRGDLVLCKSGGSSALLHRIVRIKRQHDGQLALQTKGDALCAPDKLTSENEVLGKVLLVERMHASGVCRVSDMESKPWQIINSFLAWVSLARPNLLVLGRLLQKALHRGPHAISSRR